VIAFERMHPRQRLACWFNLGHEPVDVPRAGGELLRLHAPGTFAHGHVTATHAHLPRFGFCFAEFR
jgi:hypothetical protein